MRLWWILCQSRLHLYPINRDGVPFTASYFASKGDPVTDLVEDMATEQKGHAVYEKLIHLTDNPEDIDPLQFLMGVR